MFYGRLWFIQHFVRRQIGLKIHSYLTACLVTSDSRNILLYFIAYCVCICLIVLIQRNNNKCYVV